MTAIRVRRDQVSASRCIREALDEPYGWRAPRVVFVNSMSDLFHARVPLTFMQDVFDVIAETPQHTYQVLTKRSLRLRRLADHLSWPPISGWVSLSRAMRFYRGSIIFARCPLLSDSCPASRCLALWMRLISTASVGLLLEASQARTIGRCIWSGRAAYAMHAKQQGFPSSSSNGAAGHPKLSAASSTVSFGTRCLAAIAQ